MNLIHCLQMSHGDNSPPVMSLNELRNLLYKRIVCYMVYNEVDIDVWKYFNISIRNDEPPKFYNRWKKEIKSIHTLSRRRKLTDIQHKKLTDCISEIETFVTLYISRIYYKTKGPHKSQLEKLARRIKIDNVKNIITNAIKSTTTTKHECDTLLVTIIEEVKENIKPILRKLIVDFVTDTRNEHIISGLLDDYILYCSNLNVKDTVAGIL